jgi:formylglycine-generating enzyme required for sulfatase activity
MEFEWTEIPAGEFLMGTPEDEVEQLVQKYKSVCFRHEVPQRRVYADTFEISKYPVTNAQFTEFVRATGHSRGVWPYESYDDFPDHPVAWVNLYEAQAFCQWARCRLPTEAEWEKAARGPDGFRYPWGNEWEDDRCNSRESGLMMTTPVGQYPQGASPYGVHDMAGNVWEWTSGWLISDVIPAVWWAWESPRWDPVEHGEWLDERLDCARSFPILRGGGTNSNRIGVRCAFRLIGYEPRTWGDFFGFRCVKL